jgi:hypothetical protein
MAGKSCADSVKGGVAERARKSQNEPHTLEFLQEASVPYVEQLAQVFLTSVSYHSPSLVLLTWPCMWEISR